MSQTLSLFSEIYLCNGKTITMQATTASARMKIIRNSTNTEMLRAALGLKHLQPTVRKTIEHRLDQLK
jgi:hypothetical protein